MVFSPRFGKTVFLVLAVAAFIDSRPRDMEGGKAVVVEAGAMGKKYKQDGELLKVTSMFEVLETYDSAKPYAASAKALYWPGVIFGGIGGALIGFPVGSAIAGGEFNAPVFFSGVGLATVGIVMGVVSGKKLHKAVEMYNREVGENAKKFRLDFGIGKSGPLAGVSYSF